MRQEAAGENTVASHAEQQAGGAGLSGKGAGEGTRLQLHLDQSHVEGAPLAGFGWLALGLIYLAVLTRGFRRIPAALFPRTELAQMSAQTAAAYVHAHRDSLFELSRISFVCHRRIDLRTATKPPVRSSSLTGFGAAATPPELYGPTLSTTSLITHSPRPTATTGACRTPEPPPFSDRYEPPLVLRTDRSRLLREISPLRTDRGVG